jgi:type II secretory pathway pseudopilin PulG
VPSPRAARFVTVLSLLVLAAMGGLLVPQFRATQQTLREKALAADLTFLNRALKQFAEDHGGALPGMQDGLLDQDLLRRQLTLPSTADGAIAPNGPFGPYLKAGVPPNPMNDSDELKVVTAEVMPAPDGTTGWVLHVPTARILSNARPLAR